jgi:4-amino-4-deoxy-L-arabinose transferase-like glycosyltransferase
VAISPTTLRRGTTQQSTTAATDALPALLDDWTRNPAPALVLLTVSALVLRLGIVRGPGLDETATAAAARSSLSTLIHGLSHGTHPPVYPVLLWLVAHTVGSTPTDLRLPSVIFGTLAVPMLYLAGRTFYGVPAALFAAALGVLAPLGVWYSQDIGPYVLAMLLVTVTIWAQRRAVGTGEARYWVVWALAAASLFLTEWAAALFLVTEVVISVRALDSRRCDRYGRRLGRRQLAYALIAVGLACEAGVSLLLTQIHHNHTYGMGGAASGAAPVSGSGAWTNVLWAAVGYHTSGAMSTAARTWPLALIAVIVLLVRPTADPTRKLLVGMTVVPVALLAVIASRDQQSVFEARFLIGLVPLLCLLVAGLAWTLTTRHHARRIAVAGLLSLSALALILQQTDSRTPQLSGYAAAFHQIASVARPGDEILYTPSALGPSVGYLAPHTTSARLGAAPPASAARVFVVQSSTVAGDNPVADRGALTALEHKRVLAAVLHAPGVTVWELAATSGANVHNGVGTKP